MQEQYLTEQPIEGMPNLEQDQHYKTLALKIDEGLHAQLRFIAQLEQSSVAEEVRRAIEARVAAAQESPELIARAEQVRGEIEREAAARRDAIAGFFGPTAVQAATTNGRATRRGNTATK